ncbi:cell filamentation protein Fic [Acidithiobacillus ferrivorans]|nr:cell filamentation protein Fic [Acidithiobacillus ferrivorans]
MYEGQNDPYIDASTGVLKNIFGIANAQELEKTEASLAYGRSLNLDIGVPPVPPFDMDHLKAIHKHLFQDVYSWAGEIRIIDISKGHTRFASAIAIDSAGTKLFREMGNEDWFKGRNRRDFADRAGHYLGEINVLHPFRDGNGRAQRYFMAQIGSWCGHPIVLGKIPVEKNIEASIAAYNGDSSPLADLIFSARPSVQRSRGIHRDDLE